jgi:hypothetical protein
MNPLEDNLTSRHKRNKSSMSVATTISEKRISAPLESKRISGAVYEGLSHPPTIPFFHTRAGSTDSFSTYKSTPPPTRDSRLDLPSRQYQIGSATNSARSSVVDLKRATYYDAPSSPPKRASYTEIPLYDTTSNLSARQIGRVPEAWYTADSLPASRSRTASPKKGYQPLHQRHDSSDDISSHPNPLEANPPTPRHSYTLRHDSPLSEISTNQRPSGDIADVSRVTETDPVRQDLKAKHYGELKPGTPPIMVGGNSRQVSSGTDFPSKGGFRMNKRDVSGKIAEEGRGGNENGWSTRFRKVSGL